MGGNNNLVGGVRRWFKRRSNNTQISSSSSYFPSSVASGSDEFEQEDSELEPIDDLDLSCLKKIRVSQRKMLPLDSHKKVPYFVSLFFSKLVTVLGTAFLLFA
jgi:mitogen-activated protein kinase 8